MNLAVPTNVLQSIEINHQGLLGVISQIRPIARNYLQARQFLPSFQAKLLEHFKIQNSAFFDQLVGRVAADPKQVKMVEFLSVNLKDLKIKTLIFFDEHSGNMMDVKPKNFISDFAGFSDDVLFRINAEREYLIPMLKDIST